MRSFCTARYCKSIQRTLDLDEPTSRPKSFKHRIFIALVASFLRRKICPWKVHRNLNFKFNFTFIASFRRYFLRSVRFSLMAKVGGTQDDLAVSLSLIFHLLLYSSFRLSRFENLTIMGGYWFRLSLAWPGYWFY